MTIDVTKLVASSPLLSDGKWITLQEAERVSGIGLLDLVRAAAEGRLELHGRLSWVQGVVMDIGELCLEPVIKVPGRGFLIQERPPTIPAREDRSESAYDDMENRLLPVFQSAEVAQGVLSNALKAVAVRLFYRSASTVFVSDTAVVLAVEQLEVLVADVEAMRHRLKSHLTDDELNRLQTLQKNQLQGVATSAGRKAHRPFSEGLAAFACQVLPQSNKNPKERERIRSGIGLFVELVGDLKLSEIDGDTLRSFRDGPLATVPARLNHAETKFKTKGVKATIAAIRKSGESWPILSAAERDQRMTWLCRMFRWLTGEWLTEDPSANLRGVSVLSKEQRKLAKQVKVERKPFTDDELTQIFSQSWFQTGDGNEAVTFAINRKWSPMEFWLPLLSLHAGQRIRELCQLHLSDVRQTSAGVWFLDINERTPDKSLKNGESQRVVPVHPVLISAGFIEWCQRLRQEGFQRVFPDLIWEPTTGYSKEAKRRMSAMLLAVGMPRDNTKVFHSLRHTANNAFIRLEIAMLMPEKIRLRVMGHKAGDDEGSTTYFSDFEADENAKFVNLLDFKLPPIAKFDANEGVKAIREALARKRGARKNREDMGPLKVE